VADRGPTGVAPVLQVHPSWRCNLACAHCYTSSGPHAREELRPELLLACLDDARALGYRRLAVSGGEPLLYRELPRLLERARALGMLTSITTNGMLATPRRFDPVAPLLDVVAISIDGTHAGHDAIRGRRGALRRTLDNLPTVRASGVPFGFIFTLTQHNVDSLEFVVRLAAAEGARSVQVHPLTLQGRATETLADARPDEIELATALLEATRLGATLGVQVHVDAVTGAQLAAYRGHFVADTPVRKLTDVAPVLVVDADGAVVPLTHELRASLALGSLHERPLRALAEAWLHDGAGDRLARTCALTWAQLSAGDPLAAVYWYDEVAARQPATSTRAGSRAGVPA
jgi:MoaA/NifB/PqqE/SkfB family radical SAM enzyme